MEESEKRVQTEEFLDKIIKEWERLISLKHSEPKMIGVGRYVFNRGRWIDLKKVRQLINDLKKEKKQMAENHRKQAEHDLYVISEMGKRNPVDLKIIEDKYRAIKKARKEAQ